MRTATTQDSSTAADLIPLACRTLWRCVCCLVTLVLSGVTHGLAEDWNDWRGPRRDGVSNETGLLASWPEGGPKLDWVRAGLGKGFSSVSVADGTVVTLGTQKNKEVLFALEEATGEPIWALEHGPAFRNGRGDGPRGTPVIVGDRVYALGAYGLLTVHDLETGDMIWFKNIINDFKGKVPRWGVSESPLVIDELVVVSPGGRGAGIVALDKNDGSIVWKSSNDGASYASGIAVDRGARKQGIFFTDRRGLGLDLATGELLWDFSRPSNSTANAATPIHRAGKVFFSSDYGTGGGLVTLRGDTAEETYFNRQMKNHHSSSVLVGDHLYGFSGAILTAIEFATGELAWKDRSVGKGSLLAADGKLYLYSERGTVGLATASPEGYEEISRFRLPERASEFTWAYPAIANGRLYLRADDRLYAYDVKAPNPAE